MLVEIKTRQEFAEAVNFGKYPIVVVDCVRNGGDGLTAFEPTKVRVDFGKFPSGTPHLQHCEFEVFADTYHGDGQCHCTVASTPCCLAARFCYEDAVEDIEYAAAPLLKPNGEAVIVLRNPVRRNLRVFKVEFGKALPNCQTALVFADKADSAELARIALGMAE